MSNDAEKIKRGGLRPVLYALIPLGFAIMVFVMWGTGEAVDEAVTVEEDIEAGVD